MGSDHPEDLPKPLNTVGYMGKGFHTARLAWPKLETQFCVGGSYGATGKHEKAVRYATLERAPDSLLSDHPVDLLVVDSVGATDYAPADRNKKGTSKWLRQVERTGERPRMVVESWGDQSLFDEYDGPTSKRHRTLWDKIGYVTRVHRWEAAKLNSALLQERVMVLRIHKDINRPLEWTVNSELPGRAMSNMLRYQGVPWKAYVPAERLKEEAIADAFSEPLPRKVGDLIRTHKGIRRVMPDEYARGTGVPKGWIEDDSKVGSALALNTTSVNIWEAVAETLRTSYAKATTVHESDDGLFYEHSGARRELNYQLVAQAQTKVDDPTISQPWAWTPPDLSKGGKWYKTRLANLSTAAATLPNPAEAIAEGLEQLDRHRLNYTATHPEPKHLQILWWEFPREHWTDLREGSSMNFLSEPAAGIHENAKMDEEQRAVAGTFMDELISLGAMEECPKDEPLHCSSPLFCVPKPGQPGQWRIIANCKTGGQNEAVGSDPVILPRVNHILGRMYHGGWSAVVDAAKMFYQFPTKPEERKYLGVVHPVTGKHYRYAGLPMGAGNSPAIACRYGMTFNRKLIEKHPELFGGVPTPNCWHVGLDESNPANYDPKRGFGMTWEGPEGKAAALIWSFVDDFLLHAPTYEKLCQALTAFMDLAVDCGFLCHPGKLEPPSQVVKYVGFIVNTRAAPSLSIVAGKRDRALAMVGRLLDRTEQVSALALSVVVGTLESLVEATPNRRGRGYLRVLYADLHGTEFASDEELAQLEELVEHRLGGETTTTLEEVMAAQGDDTPPHWKYYRFVDISKGARLELDWWQAMLSTETSCRTSFSERGHVLTPTWGDGSGTGTGGTIAPATLQLTQWMGAWLPASLSHSSNWKELDTAWLTLHQIGRDPSLVTAVEGTTVFYFTDNLVTYYIINSGASRVYSLHSLILRIKDLETKLKIRLEVVHVPGNVMIVQGTDGLSRGVWIGSDHTSQPTPSLTKTVFDPVRPHWMLSSWVQQQCGSSGIPSLRDWKNHWSSDMVLGQFGLWLPPPTMAQQLLYFLLGLWAEQPLQTSFALLVPRVLQREWQYLSRYVQRIGEYAPMDVPCSRDDTTLPIPLVLLYVPSHTRILKIYRKTKFALPASSERHREQADEMRGL
jgi:hypothetical protein